MTWQFWVQFSAVLIAIFLLLGLTEVLYRVVVRLYRRAQVEPELKHDDYPTRIMWRKR